MGLPGGDPSRLREIASAAESSRSASEGWTPDVTTRLDEGAGGWLGEAETKALLREAGIPVPPGRIVDTVDDCLAVATELGWPLALKLSSPSIQHKSEAGALVLGIGDAPSLIAALQRLLALPAYADADVLIERMAPPGVELLVAARADAVVPALVIGLGGIWTETLGDVAVIPLPASPERVERALLSLRGAALLTGGRGTKPIDIAVISRAASRIGELLIAEGLELVELNPLIAGPQGCVAADAVARSARPGFTGHEGQSYT